MGQLRLLSPLVDTPIRVRPPWRTTSPVNTDRLVHLSPLIAASSAVALVLSHRIGHVASQRCAACLKAWGPNLRRCPLAVKLVPRMTEIHKDYVANLEYRANLLSKAVRNTLFQAVPSTNAGLSSRRCEFKSGWGRSASPALLSAN